MLKIKKSLCAAITLCMLIVMSATFPVIAKADSNNIDSISTAAELAEFANLVNDGNDFKGETITLANDINLNNTPWTPIGNDSNQFKGTFDGNNHTISGVYINSTSDYQGLFGYVNGIIKNFGVEKSNISGKNYVGGVAGYNNGTIINCYNTAAVSGTEYVGGVAGYNYWGAIINCYNTAAVSGSQEVGGVAGYNGGNIINCYNAGAVSGLQEVGGVVGYNDCSTTAYCYWNSDTYKGGNCVGAGDSNSNCSSKTSTEMKSSDFLDLLNDWNSDWYDSFSQLNLVKWKQSSKVNNGYPIFEYQKIPSDNPTTTAAAGEVTTNTFNNAEVNTNKKTTTTAVTTTVETQPEPKAGGTSGWTKLEEKILKADSGDEIYINMNGTTTVPKNIMSDIMGKDVDVTFDMGTYSWTINGKDITNPQNVNLGLTYTPNVIDFDTVNVLADGKPIMQFQLDYNGSFGFVGTCTLQLPSDKAGQFANLYYYNPETGKLEFQTCGLIKSNGYVELDFSHASDYVIVVDKTAMGTISAGAVSEDDAKPITANGIFYIAITGALAIGIIVVKKKI